MDARASLVGTANDARAANHISITHRGSLGGRDVGDVGAGLEHLSDRLVALLNHRKLHQHDEILLGSVEHK